jgi:hypothetical protein
MLMTTAVMTTAATSVELVGDIGFVNRRGTFDDVKAAGGEVI